MKKILNIFSKEKDKEELPITIQVDNRERNSLVPSELISLGLKVEWKQLPVADYLVGKTAIERKTVADLKASIINKRISQQLLELKQYQSHILIVEGIIEEDIYSSGIHENALRGFLLSVALEYQTPIIFTHNEKDTAKYIYVLARKQSKPPSNIRASKILKSKEQQQQFILEGFPNVGATKAKALIKKFKTLKEIFNAPEQELEEVLGKRANDFRDMLD